MNKQQKQTRLDLAVQILKVQLSSPAYSPGLTHDDFVKDEQGGTYTQINGVFGPWNPQQHKGRGRYSIRSVEDVIVRDAFKFADLVLDYSERPIQDQDQDPSGATLRLNT